MPATIYTIGHSTHPAEYFLELLTAHGINCVVDVRSVAASRYNPQYNQKRLSEFLSSHGIAYLHFAEAFGARQTLPEVLDENGRVDFEKVRQSSSFHSGIQRLRQGMAKGYTVALMCAESDPLDCHRFVMITPALVDEGFEVRHVLKDKSLLSNPELEDRLLKKYEKKLPRPDVFQRELSREEKLMLAFRLRNLEVGWKAGE
jgi:uncharacterized protein (DUF488 family)